MPKGIGYPGNPGKGMKARLGSGARFKALKGKLARQGVRDPGALAASIGRKKHGKAKFQKLASAGRRRGMREKLGG